MKIINPKIEVEKYDGVKIMKNIERACRTCYRSENLITEDSYKRLLTNCLNRGHGCYDEKTEVLTRAGWKYWKNVTTNDEFLSLTPDGGLEYLKPIQIFRYNYSGNLYYINSRGVNLMVTPNHNMYCCITTTKNGRKKELNSYKLYQMKDLVNYTHSYYKSSSYIAYNTNCELSLSELSLYGFAIGDGYYAEDKHCLEFHLKKERKQKYLLALCNHLGLDIRISGNKYRIYNCNMFDKYPMYTDNKDKCINEKLLYNINADQGHAILDGLINSDGCSKTTNIEYTTTSKILANQVQILCVISGIFATIINNGNAKINKCGFGTKPIYILTIGASRFAKPNIKNRNSIKQVPYNGYVYCAELPKNHTLYIRRYGKTVWCGNSVLEHEKITVRMTCDIGVYKELTRHRFGSFSIESTRYCAYNKHKFNNEIKFIEPCNIEKGTTEYAQWLNVMNIIEKTYNEMARLGCTPDQIRAILPHSTAAEVTMTANIREWRHILDLRTKKMAHPSVRQILIPLLLKFKKDMPELFEDIEYDTEFPKEWYAEISDMED